MENTREFRQEISNSILDFSCPRHGRAEFQANHTILATAVSAKNFLQFGIALRGNVQVSHKMILTDFQNHHTFLGSSLAGHAKTNVKMTH